MKTGERRLQSLRDGREVYILGRQVADVTTHPAFRNSVASAAYVYDFQSNPDNVERMTFVSPDTGDRVSRSWNKLNLDGQPSHRGGVAGWGSEQGRTGVADDAHRAFAVYARPYIGRAVVRFTVRRAAGGGCRLCGHRRLRGLFRHH